MLFKKEEEEEEAPVLKSPFEMMFELYKMTF